MNFESLAQEFHSAAVVGIDVCTRKPLIASCSMDASVRVWNYEDRTCEIASSFDEAPLSISFHPSGLHVLVGFPDRLSLMNVLMDDIRSFKDFAIKDCRESAFSNGGQYFAAASGSSISVYATFSGVSVCVCVRFCKRAKRLVQAKTSSISEDTAARFGRFAGTRTTAA